MNTPLLSSPAPLSPPPLARVTQQDLLCVLAMPVQTSGHRPHSNLRLLALVREYGCWRALHPNLREDYGILEAVCRREEGGRLLIGTLSVAGRTPHPTEYLGLWRKEIESPSSVQDFQAAYGVRVWGNLMTWKGFSPRPHPLAPGGSLELLEPYQDPADTTLYRFDLSNPEAVQAYWTAGGLWDEERGGRGEILVTMSWTDRHCLGPTAARLGQNGTFRACPPLGPGRLPGLSASWTDRHLPGLSAELP